MDPLWKLPPTDLHPTGDGSWQVQSEQGLGKAWAVFAPLRRRQDENDWELAVDDQQDLDVTCVNDAEWTTVPFPHAPQADHFLCLLRYDHPEDHPGDSYRRLSITGTLDDVPAIPGAQLRRALAQLQSDPELHLDLHVVRARTPHVASRSVPTGEAPTAARAPSPLCFAFASCQYPAGMLDRRVAYRSHAALADYLKRKGGPVPERLLLLGDQVYTDATYGLLDPVRADDRYRIPYEEFNDRQGGPFAALPQWFLGARRMTPDDHEIRDNWEPGSLLPEHAEAFDLGLAAYWRHQRRSAPLPKLQMDDHGPGWCLFMADSRTQRDPRTETTLQDALILGKGQTQDLEDWLLLHRDPLKIVTTAAMLLPRQRIHRDAPLYLDDWQGFPASFGRLIAFLWDNEVRNAVFLSGDAHLACDARVTVRREDSTETVRFAALHAPALYAPYPFANETAHNFQRIDRFTVRHGGKSYLCEVKAAFFDRSNGCGMLRAKREGSDWSLDFGVLAPIDPQETGGPIYEILTPCSAAM